jgi:mono/diheme cytochrome c family protein
MISARRSAAGETVLARAHSTTRRVFGWGLVLAIALGSACRFPPRVSQQADPEADARSVARGEPLYLQNCAPCHGASGEGNGPLAKEFDPPPTNLVASGIHVSTRGLELVISTPHYSSRLVEERVTTGNREMPAWKEVLTQQQIDDVVAYVRNLMAMRDGS